ncbi:MAG TPA: F0F1 ATP synthase subunit delta [Microbacterium sp.]|uniref:F0F1 ATP synthase subunit delta n=1 Tax=Microbacterium sp. TaxID=51671 RepID=UPI000ED6E506|nr:F0F1 ATP synthase subunit delta [Microbacterium sp.]
MGSATTQALAASTNALAAASGITLDTAGEFFSAAALVGESSQLSGALADSTAPAGSRAAVVAKVFAGASPAVRDVLTVVAGQRWSTAADIVDAIEELAIRATAIAEPTSDIEGELFSFLRVVADNPELELALGSRLGDSASRSALVGKLLTGASASVKLITTSLVRQPRGRRIRQLLNRAMSIVSLQRGRTVATVHTAAPLSAAQSTRLSDALARRYGAQVSLNVVIDPTVVGGLRVQIADDVIDGSISARLADLRHKLAG